MEVRKQQYEPINDCFEIIEHVNVKEADFFGVSSFEHVLQLYLMGFFSICQNFYDTLNKQRSCIIYSHIKQWYRENYLQHSGMIVRLPYLSNVTF